MAQVTRDMCEHIITAAARHEYFPLTTHEMWQLAYLAMQTIVSAATVDEPSDKLDAPAQVGNTVFGKGVKTRLVIEAAQRNHQRTHNPTEEDKRITAATESIARLRKQIEQEHDAKSPFQREVERLGKPQAEPGAYERSQQLAVFLRLAEVVQADAKTIHDRFPAQSERADQLAAFMKTACKWAVQSGQRAGVAEGWQLVPVEPSEYVKAFDAGRKSVLMWIDPSIKAEIEAAQQQAEPSDPNEIACSSCGLTMGENNALAAMKQAEPGADEVERAAIAMHAMRRDLANGVGDRTFDMEFDKLPDEIKEVDRGLARAAIIAAQQPEHVGQACGDSAEHVGIQQAEPGADERRLPGVHGVSRIADNPCALLLLLKGEPSDDALREIHDRLRAQPKIEGHHDETSSRAKDALRGIGACIADPMWANHAEVSKQTLKYWHKSLTDVLAAQSDQRAGVAEPEGWREFITEVAQQKPEKPDYWSSCGQCQHNADRAQDLIAVAPTQQQQEGGHE